MTLFQRVGLSLDVLTFSPWRRAGVPHGFSFRRRRVEGNEPFGTRDKPERQAEDLRDLTAALALKKFVAMRQVHGPDVLAVCGTEEEPTCDGVTTREKGVALVVQSADCVPILLWDPLSESVGAVHAGWRGTLAGVAGAAVARLSPAPASVEAVMGPCIGVCCYEVGDEVVEAFVRRFEKGERALFRPGPRGKKHLDLIEANRRQLAEAGVRPENIHSADRCTFCENDFFYSFRKEGPGVGRLFAAIGIS